jgi:dolichol-phosphate mannosyltransferase
MLAGYRVKEVPIVFRDRSSGTSKMSARIATEAIWLVPRLRRTVPAALASAHAGATDAALPTASGDPVP